MANLDTKTIDMPVPMNLLKKALQRLKPKELLDIHNVLEEKMVEYEDTELSKNPKIIESLRCARAEYKKGKYKNLREVIQKKKRRR